MTYRKSLVLWALLGAVALGSAPAQAVDYVDAKPLSQVVKTAVQACGSFRELRLPFIAWGGDMPSIYGNGNTELTAPGSIFHKKGLNIRLYREDRLVAQVEDYLACKTPFLRGTIGMLTMAGDAINADPRTRPVIFYKLTDSFGGDVVVVQSRVGEVKDIKKVVMQAYGPHPEFFATLAKLGVDLSKVEVKWVRDITDNPKDKSSVFPAKAFREDKSVDAVFVISPDANALTSGGKVGTGAEDSVKGARALLSTKTCDTCIIDVYAVRKDFYDANRQLVDNLVHGLLLGQEAAADLMSKKTQQKRAYDDFIKASAKMLLDSPDLTADVEGMWGDARFAGWKGNVSFFQDKNNQRNFDKLTAEVGGYFATLKLIAKPVSLTPAVLDYGKLGEGIRDKSGVEAPRFNKDMVDRLVRERQQKDTLAEGQLFSFEIRFAPNQQSFSGDLYGGDFDKVIDLMSTNAGALLTIEGHADTLAYLKRKGEPSATSEELSRIKQGGKNLTLQRANAVRDALLRYAGGKSITLDPNQFSTVGHGFSKPNVTGCTWDRDGDITVKCAPRTKDEWDAMRRVVFRVVSVEAEMTEFEALGSPSAKK